ncbi:MULTISPECIES: hypothetical protein [Brucella]|uniref:Uncharacterized protein n=1 Tax=Brucella pseudogrignonensis TaxID=419475 RepID=A0A256GPC3_9HYPH|nr:MULTISPECIES: hypothetical protein [Brucella]NVM42694.1 hypothetical protein [Brucella intermedia]OYR28431.1 hypothetical protein CEV34_1139 [Brucella pseudogrignonensis]
MDADLYELSDTLFEWRREFLRYENQGVFLTPADVRAVTATLYGCAALAMNREHEISRHRWNGMGRSDDRTRQALLDELFRPDSNIVLFKPDFTLRADRA